jgi:hypothetical protein
MDGELLVVGLRTIVKDAERHSFTQLQGNVGIGRTCPQPSSSSRAVPMKLNEEQCALHALNRLTLGPRPGDLQKVMAMDATARDQPEIESLRMVIDKARSEGPQDRTAEAYERLARNLSCGCARLPTQTVSITIRSSRRRTRWEDRSIWRHSIAARCRMCSSVPRFSGSVGMDSVEVWLPT